MLTNRKKLKNRKKQIKIILASVLFVLLLCAILSYSLWVLVLSKVHYISPLSSNSSSQYSAQTDKDIEKLKDELKKQKIEFLAVNYQNSDYMIVLKDDKQVILSSQKDINAQISSLQFMLTRLKMESRQFTRLDLRYDKPIIVFK